MFEVNLIREKNIPPQLKRDVSRYFIIAGGLGGLILILIFVRFLAVGAKVSKYKHEKEVVSSEINRMVHTLNIKEWGNEWSGIYKDLKLIGGVYDERMLWMIKLQELARLLPKKMCITRINMNVKEKYIELNVIALEEEKEFVIVKKFLDDINNSPVFGKGAKLKSQQRSKIGGIKIKIMDIMIPLAE